MVLEVIEKRRSIRKFTDKPVSEEEIRDILEAAFLAPTAVNKQEWRFVVVRNREKLVQLSEVNPYARMTKDCAFSIIVGYEKGVNDRFGVVDCGAAIENMLLQSQSMGIGSVWCALMDGEEKSEEYKKILALPDSFATVATVQFGYPDEERETPQRFDASKIIFVD